MEETYLEIAVRKKRTEQYSSVNINFTQGRGVADVKTSEKTELRGLVLMSVYLTFRRVWVNQKACSSTCHHPLRASVAQKWPRSQPGFQMALGLSHFSLINLAGWAMQLIRQWAQKQNPISVGSVTHSLPWVEASGGQHRRDCWAELLHASCGGRGTWLRPIQDQLCHV